MSERMALRLYSLLTRVLAPLALGFLAFKSWRSGGKPQLGQRLGWGAPRLNGGIWLHAVSVGEVQAALPLLRSLRERYPDRPILVTTTTTTGYARVSEALGDKVQQAYLPYDTPGAVKRFMREVRPDLVIIIETELWPNLYYAIRRAGAPLLLANARLSARSARGYSRLMPLVRQTVAQIDKIAAQSNDDAAHFYGIGAAQEQLVVTGNLKFDLSVPEQAIAEGRALRQRLGGRPTWIAASTHEGEDERVLQVHARLRRDEPDLLLILVPRHPQRFDRVAASVKSAGFRLARRSQGQGDASTEVYLGDTMGELMTLFAASDIAFVGGSLVPVGGHNLLEPAALGLPVLTGPHVFNFKYVTEKLVEGGGAEVVETDEELRLAVLGLLVGVEHRAEIGEAARRQVEGNRGALDRTLSLVDTLLVDKGPSGSPHQLGRV